MVRLCATSPTFSKVMVCSSFTVVDTRSGSSVHSSPCTRVPSTSASSGVDVGGGGSVGCSSGRSPRTGFDPLSRPSSSGYNGWRIAVVVEPSDGDPLVERWRIEDGGAVEY